MEMGTGMIFLEREEMGGCHCSPKILDFAVDV